MPTWYQLKFLPGGNVEDFFGSRGNHYKLADGSELEVHARPVWCEQCREFTEGESIESVEEIDRYIEELKDPSTCHYQRAQNAVSAPHGHFRRKLIADAERRRRWRLTRTAPAKCLICGTTDIRILPFHQVMPDPLSAGTILLEAVGMCSTQFNNWYFTPEGDRIPGETKPTYWGPPKWKTRNE